MSAFLVAFRTGSLLESLVGPLCQSVDLAGTYEQWVARDTGAVMVEASLPDAPLGGPRHFEDHDWVLLFAGDLIDCHEVPFVAIRDALASDEFQSLQRLEGIFAIVAYDKRRRRLFLVTDRRGQKPLYWQASEIGMTAGTSLSSFCRLEQEPQFNREWLWELLYFNYPVTDTTFLRNVQRVPAATVLRYSLDSREVRVSEYAPMFAEQARLMSRPESFEYAREVFADRVPRYFHGAQESACALTGGWDGRTVLALAPEPQSVTAYTYGVPGCNDLVGARSSAQQLELRHREIVFDDALVARLPDLMLETVFLSGGLERISRASLVHVYRDLTESANRFPLTLSGIGIDTQFRGHAHVPFLVSKDMGALLEGQSPGLDQASWKQIWASDYNSFRSHVVARTVGLEDRFGELASPAAHLSYSIYVLAPRHFCGELEIAKNYTTVRVPSWDQQVVDLSYAIEESMLSYSQFTDHVRGSREEMLLQAYLLQALAPRFAAIPVGYMTPATLLKGGFKYQAARNYGRIVARLPATRRPVGPENNALWLRVHRQFIDGLLFGDDTRVRGYVSEAYLARLMETRDLRQICWLATAEVIVRLIEHRWSRFW